MARKESTKLNPPPDASFPLSSMIDVVFLLLIFFLVTQKPVTEEVMINVELPAPDMSTVAADPLIPITIDVDKYSRDNIDEIDARLAALGDRDDPNEVLKDERLYYSFNGSAPMEVARLRERLAAARDLVGAVVLDDAALDHPQELSVRARLERAAYLADDRNLTAKFVAGQKILG